ncbi:glucose-6-phosphate isomerase [Oceaniglobus roseus]|uniref:glucose-6-phosphate isomerase n=1 Tax=Oceaniglobus roseus TaxID=1737570 RepID=UPI000C7F1886|nr:glucose-6-phosphate isomerase [Kandeliimicrobium roseum]
MTVRPLLTAAALSLAVLPACENMTTGQRTAVGLTGGAAVGLITAEALNASNEWLIIGALLGAAAGTLVAQNSATGDCAYAYGDGRYYTRRCPR